MLSRLNYCLVGYYGRFLEDFISVKIRRWQNGVATSFDYAVLRRLHLFVLKRLSTIPSEAGTNNEPTSTRVGLHNSRVAVELPNAAWEKLANAESLQLSQLLNPFAVTIHHVGSTSVRGLSAKPIIDLAIAVERPDFDGRLMDIINQLQASGYRYLGDWKRRGGHFLEKANGQIRSYAVQVHCRDSDDFSRLLRFRNLLSGDPKLVQRYSEVKVFLARVLRHQRGLYFWYKSHWLNELLLEDHGPSAWGEWWVSARYPTTIQFLQRSVVRMLTRGRCGKHPLSA